MKALGFCLALSLAAPPVVAGDIRLALPIDCTLGESCFLLNLVDDDPGPDAADFTCGPRSYDGHKGTDIALPSFAAMNKGVNVTAAAPGIVRGARDGMRDVLYSPDQDSYINGRDCGNGVSIDHGDGWVTQYCHMAQGSIAVRAGDHVDTGAVLGQVGLSGRTQFPHVHISVRKDTEVVDPFRPDRTAGCRAQTAPAAQLWQTPIAYPAGGIIAAGITSVVPDFSTVKSGRAALDTVPGDGPALVAWGFVYGSRAGDILRLRLSGPTGIVIEKEIPLTKTQVLSFRAIGRKTRAPWPSGDYVVQSQLIRGGKILDHLSTRATIR